MVHSYVCNHCGVVFNTRKNNKKFCKKECYYASKDRSVINTCAACNSNFTVAYRFRTQKTCNFKCAGRLAASNHSRETKNCLVCQTPFKVIQSRKEKSKYCSYDCYLSTRKTRQPDVEKLCEFCGNKFVVKFTRSNKRFCNKICSNSGENNGMFGKPGSMTGKQSWNHGLTVETDERVAALGKKISIRSKSQFKTGVRSNRGDKNPNYGNTSDTLTPEKRKHFSEAAVNRILSGVSGYKTGHLNGEFIGEKTSSIVKFKSSWELAAMMMWETDDNVVSYEYEPRVVVLPDHRRAIPDFYVTYKNSESEFIEIKPTMIQQLPVVKEKLEQIRIQLNNEGVRYTLIGNDEIKRYTNLLGDDFLNAVERYKNRI